MSRTRFRVNPHFIVAWMSRNRHGIWSLSDCNGTPTHNQLISKQTHSHLVKLAKWLSCVVSTLCHSKTCTWHDKNIQSNVSYRQVLTTQLNYLTSLAKWLSVRLRTKWLWAWVPLQSLKHQISPISSKKFLDIQATIECGFTPKRARDMIRIYSQMHCTDRYSQHSSMVECSFTK